MEMDCITNRGAAAVHGKVYVDDLLAGDMPSPAIHNDDDVASLISPMVSNHHHPREQQAMTQDIATEHRIFLRALLDLLTERDNLVLERADLNSQNIIKIGYLRKASRRITGLWKTKFVEIRKGTFSYFDVNVNQRQRIRSIGQNNDRSNSMPSGMRQLQRKDIPLRTSSCICRAVNIRTFKLLPMTSNSEGSVFELHTNGGSRRLWMANSPEERQAWMQTIHNSMIGASVIRGDNFLQYQVAEQTGKGLRQTEKIRNLPLNIPYRDFLEQYLDIRGAIHVATTKEDYCAAVSRLRDNSITVPVQWIKSQLDDAIARSYFVENEISSCVEQLWKDLLRDTVEINGEILLGDSFHGPERIVGKLTQQIFSPPSSDGSLKGSQRNILNQHLITEVQSIAYARDILLASGRTRSGGDSYFCAENLCLNRNLVVLCPSSSEVTPLSINVSTRFRTEKSDSIMTDLSGFVFTRHNPGKPWMRQYLVLSNGVLSCYADDAAEPPKLLEKVMIQGANLNISHIIPKVASTQAKSMKESLRGHIVKITTNGGVIVREYLFEDDYVLWHNAMKETTDVTVEYAKNEEQRSASSNGHQHTSGATECSAVDVVVNVCTEYKACTLDPSGIDGEDTWA